MSGRAAVIGPLIAVPGFFALRIASALLLLKVSALTLPVAGFSLLTQFLLFGALINMIAAGGAQTGIIREVAAAADEAAIARARMGGLALWGAAVLVIGVPVALLSRPVADLLVGDTSAAWAAPLVLLATFAAGPGQIYAAILTGRGRVATSLSTQGAGLVLGTGGALALLVQREPLWAAIAFAAGPILSAAIGWWLVRRMNLPPANRTECVIEARRLIGYSAAFLSVALYSSLIFFGVRYAYREAFGLEALGFWLVANRISDVDTQLLGLFMTQVFVPRFAAIADAAARHRTIAIYWAIAAGTMALPLLIFALAPQLLVRLFLSARYFPAIGFILAYMAGDFLRVWGSMAMHAAFAQAQLLRFTLIEIGTVTLFAIVALVLIAVGDVRGPVIAYPLAYGCSAILITIAFLRARAVAGGAPPS